MPRWELSSEGRQSLLRFLQALVRTSSPSGREGSVAALIVDEMRRLGYDEVHVDEAGNVVGRIGPARGPALMFDSHMDTVEVADPQYMEGRSLRGGGRRRSAVRVGCV